MGVSKAATRDPSRREEVKEGDSSIVETNLSCRLKPSNCCRSTSSSSWAATSDKHVEKRKKTIPIKQILRIKRNLPCQQCVAPVATAAPSKINSDLYLFLPEQPVKCIFHAIVILYNLLIWKVFFSMTSFDSVANWPKLAGIDNLCYLLDLIKLFSKTSHFLVWHLSVPSLTKSG